MAARQEATIRELYRGAKQFRRELDHPDNVGGPNRLGGLAEFYYNPFLDWAMATGIDVQRDDAAYVNPRQALEGIQGASDAIQALIEATFDVMSTPNPTAEQRREMVNRLKGLADRFLETNPVVSNMKGLLAIKGVSKAGLPVPPEMEREVVGFLSPSGKSEGVNTAISRSAVSLYKPGVYGKSESAPPPGGVGPAAAGAGGPAGGKRRRRKTRRARRARYSRRR